MTELHNKPEYRHTDQEEIDEFHKELCDLIDEHAESEEEKSDFINSLEEFKDSWSMTYSITGAFWVTEEDVEEINNKVDNGA